MTERLLVDTGPIVALLKRSDAHHNTCKSEVRDHQGPLLTCWPVITEAAWLLRNDARAVRRLLASIDAGLFEILDLDGRAPSWMGEFPERYRTLGAQLADAALVYLAEREGIDTVFTLDRRDFSVYRLTSGEALRIIPEG